MLNDSDVHEIRLEPFTGIGVRINGETRKISGDVIKLSDSQTLRVRRSTPDVLELTSTWEPSVKPPPTHWHPSQRERFEVLAGELTVELAGQPPRVFTEGDVIDVPARTAHRMWNAGQGQVSAIWTVTPTLRTEEMFRYIDQGLDGLRKLALLVKFRNEFRLGSPHDRP